MRPPSVSLRLERTFAGSFSSSDLALKEELERLIRDLRADPAAQRAAGFRQVEEMLEKLGYPAAELGAVQGRVAAEEERGVEGDGGPARGEPDDQPRVVLVPDAIRSSSYARSHRLASAAAPTGSTSNVVTDGLVEQPAVLQARRMAESPPDIRVVGGDLVYAGVGLGGASAITTAAARATGPAPVRRLAASTGCNGEGALNVYHPWIGACDMICRRLRHIFSRQLCAIAGSVHRRHWLGVLARRTLVRWRRQYTLRDVSSINVRAAVHSDSPHKSRRLMGVGIGRMLSEVWSALK